jgi:hypothetical protein
MVVDDDGLDGGWSFVVAAFIWRMRPKLGGVDGVRFDFWEVNDGDSCGGESIGRRCIEPDRREVDTEGFESSGHSIV